MKPPASKPPTRPDPSPADPSGGDWTVHLLQLAARDNLGQAGKGRLLDLPALAQAWTCATGACTPGRRAPNARSCCADLELAPTAPERAAIDAALPEIAAFLAPRDPRWAEGAPAIYEGDAVRRPGKAGDRRCVFAGMGPDGLYCGLHALEDASGRARGALKPLACRLFPLVLVEVDERTTLLSAIHRNTARLAGSRPARAFPCIGAAGAPTIAESCADTITALWGARAAKNAQAAVAGWRERAE
ncbi:MAG: hypothetical protein Q8P18_18605 [Pseudomonadota bacterium]|nr:hypothetical protein [Pseudomonadota bacterium]